MLVWVCVGLWLKKKSAYVCDGLRLMKKIKEILPAAPKLFERWLVNPVRNKIIKTESIPQLTQSTYST
jgi:hypothetical protein